MRKEAVELTPRGHLPLAEHHSHDLHKQVSSQSFVGPPAVPQYQTYEPDPV